MNLLQTIMDDFINIKECYFWIDYYNRLDNKEQIDLYNEKINLIYKKYRAKNLNELINVIISINYYSKIETDLNLCKNVLFSVNQEKPNIPAYDDTVFKKMYTYIISNDLYNPNWSMGTSSEPLYVLLPIVPDLLETNLLVYNNPTIDWQILNNGSDSFMGFIYKYLESKDDLYKKYYYEIIKTALDTSCDIDCTLRYKSESKRVKYQIEPIKDKLLKIDDMSIKRLLNRKIFINK